MTKRGFERLTGAGGIWLSFARSIIVMIVALALVIAALTTVLLLVPLALAVGVALHLYMRRRLRRAVRSSRVSHVVIDGDYEVIDRK